MTTSRRDECSTILEDIGAGRSHRADDLLPLLYDELRELARAAVRQDGVRPDMDATMLVHEAFLRLVGDDDPGWNGRGHFFGAAAKAMRRILVDQARRRGRERHGGGWARVTLSNVDVAGVERDGGLLRVDDVVSRLEAVDPLKGQIVDLRFFAGRSMAETAKMLDVSLSTVEREWRFIKGWLRAELAATD